GRARARSVARVEVDLARALAESGGGRLDPHTIEVVGYGADGRPYVFDAAATGSARHALPWRAQALYPLSRVELSFVVPKGAVTRYAVYFDAAGSPTSDPRRYAGLVGDGDFFSEGYGRREIAPSAFDDMGDIDGDGDLELVEGGTEPVLRVSERVQGARYVDAGWLTSAGEKLVLPRDERNRSWVSVALHDWDGDGDADLFASFMAGPFMNRVLRYENTSARGGPLTFAERGPLLTAPGPPVVGRVSFADWDGDGRTDVLAAWEGLVALHRNLGGPAPVAAMNLGAGQYLQANGEALQLEHARVQAADLDGDSDLDLVAGEVEGRLFWFENVGTRAEPLLTVGRMLAWHGYMDAYLGVAVRDFDGDGRPDILCGRFWDRSASAQEPRVFGRLFRGTGAAGP
ncbi:MAG TPA: VCBS repeat-containing protein, partial [Vicinamibacteria bacterium]|nr:VCBS repeat-containing protein [Vicinamibacteria bacterium]